MKQFRWLTLLMVLLFSCSYKLKIEKKETKALLPDLNGTWAIVEVNSEKVVKEKTANLPFLAFNPSENSLNGSTGCNRITGKAIVMDGVVDFVSLATTRMFCKNSNYETPLLQLLRGSLSYKLENNLLIFTKEGRKVVVLQKE